MATGPIPDLNLSVPISPMSSASNGLDYFSQGGIGIGGINLGAGDGTALSPVIKDAATAIALVIGAAFLWKRLK